MDRTTFSSIFSSRSKRLNTRSRHAAVHRSISTLTTRIKNPSRLYSSSLTIACTWLFQFIRSPNVRTAPTNGGLYGKICTTALAWSIPIAGGQPVQRHPPPAAYPSTAPASDHRTGSSSVACTKTPRKILYHNQDSEPAQIPPEHPRI